MQALEEIVIGAIRALDEPADPAYPDARAWTARICRHLNGLSETPASVAYCGLCRDYANPRKRKRASYLPAPLPGFERGGGGYALHAPCPRALFRVLRSTLSGLKDKGKVVRERVKIPDTRTPKGWDFASNWRLR